MSKVIEKNDSRVESAAKKMLSMAYTKLNILKLERSLIF
jgi:hypothetical protein